MSRPRLVPLSRRLVPGLLALGLFGVFAAVVYGTGFTGFAAYPDDVSITASIGYSLFDFEALQESQGVPGTEPFLISFLLIAIVLDAALDASLVLANRETSDESVRPTAFGDSASSPEPAAERVVDQPTAQGEEESVVPVARGRGLDQQLALARHS